MLKLRKYNRLISFFLILLLIFVVITNAFTDKCSDRYTTKPPIIYSVRTVHTDITFSNSDSRKTNFHLISSDIYDNSFGCIFYADVSEYKSIYPSTPPECGNSIKQAILHYFHGSKYKDGSLFI